MADINWPTGSTDPGFALASYVEEPEWDVEISYSRNGKVFTRALPGMRWTARLAFPPIGAGYAINRGRLEALLMQLRGGANRLVLWHLLRPAPAGTIAGTPTVSGAVGAGATSCSITGTAGQTWLRGDRFAFGAGGQRVMAVNDGTLPGTLQFEPQLRAAVSNGTALVWDKPTTRYVLRRPSIPMPAEKTMFPGFSIELVEE